MVRRGDMFDKCVCVCVFTGYLISDQIINTDNVMKFNVISMNKTESLSSCSFN